MSDLYKVASAFTSDPTNLRVRFGKVVSVQTGRTITVTIAGSTSSVSGVRYTARMAPEPGSVVILLTDGADLFALDHVAAADLTLAPRVNRTTDQTLTTATDTAVTWQAVNSDAWGMWAAGSPTRLTAVVTGRYTATAQVRFAANSTGIREAYIRKNGSTDLARDRANALTSGATASTLHAPAFDMVVGDYIELWVLQNSGGNLALAYQSIHEPSLTMTYLGP